MSHESGFRRGGQDFGQKPGPGRRGKRRGNRTFEERMAKRFHDHEREVQAARSKDEPETEAAEEED
jgi:hypothetical protein